MSISKPERVRVLLISPGGRFLLIKYRNTDQSGLDRPCWITPGGGMERGESVSDAALREIREETGIVDVRLGPLVWYGEDSQRSGDWRITFKEHFIVADCGTEAIDGVQWTEHEHDQILETRWWSFGELQKSKELIYPLGMAEILQPVLAGNYPNEIIVLSPIW